MCKFALARACQWGYLDRTSCQEENGTMTSAWPSMDSDLTRRTLAIVMAGGNGTRLGELTRWHSKPALPFAGQYRNIDFPLSNCVGRPPDCRGHAVQGALADSACELRLELSAAARGRRVYRAVAGSAALRTTLVRGHGRRNPSESGPHRRAFTRLRSGSGPTSTRWTIVRCCTSMRPTVPT